MNVYKASDILGALELLSSGSKVMAGCTNIYVDIKKTGAPDSSFVDISAIDELRSVSRSDDGSVRIGCLATFDDLEKFFEGEREFGALYGAARDMGAPQIRNRATLAGNICDASPACDGGPALLVSGASVTLLSKDGERTVSIDGFFKGRRETAVKPGELLTFITLPPLGGPSFFKKVGLRNALSISVVSLAGKKLGDGSVRLAMGSVCDRPVRLFECEALIGQGSIDTKLLKEALGKDISPISDIRASREYRLEVAENLLIDSLEKEFSYEFI